MRKGFPRHPICLMLSLQNYKIINVKLVYFAN